MAAFEVLCLCGGHLEPLIQRGLLFAARTLGKNAGVIFHCPDCGHVCALPMPVGQNQKQLNNILYNPQEGEVTSYDRTNVRKMYESSTRQHVIDLILNILSRHFGITNGIRLHDFGTGPGDLVHHLRREGVDATGSDPDPDAMALAHELGNTYIVHSADTPVSEMPYQAILMHHVLEHVVQPVDFLSRCRSLLVTGGLIILLVPNGEFLPARTLDFNGWNWSNVPGHLHFFSKRSLSITLTNAGFVGIHVTGTECGLSSYMKKDPATPFEEDSLQTSWLMQAAFPAFNG